MTEFGVDVIPVIDCFQTDFHTLTDDEYNWCLEYAHDVFKYHKQVGGRGGWSDDYKGRVTFDIEGAVGEFAYHKIFNNDPYSKMKLTDYIGEQWDDVMNGKKIQIKSTAHKEVYLILNPKDLRHCDFAVRMRVNGNTAHAVGYITPTEFLRLAQKDKRITRYKMNLSIHSSALHYIFWLPYHTKYGDKWLQWWRSRRRNHA